MRRRFFWGMVAVAVVTLTVGGTAAAVLVNNSVESSIRSEFERQALATARIIESEVGPGRSNPDSGGRARIGDVLRASGSSGGTSTWRLQSSGPGEP